MPRKDVPSFAQATFQQRWTLEEDMEFLQAMRLCSYGKWTRISDIMGGSRTPLQVKNRARHLLTYDVDSPLAVELKALAGQAGVSYSGRRAKRDGLDVGAGAGTGVDGAWNARPLDVLLSDDDCDDPGDLLTAEDILEESTTLGDDADDDGEESLRSSIIALWEAHKPLQLSLEYLFKALPERNMEAVTALYYLLEEENMINSSTPRKRRVRDEHGNWVEAGGEGRTIVHGDDGDHRKVFPAISPYTPHHTRSSTSFRALSKQKRGRKAALVHDDDFELFECLLHSADRPAPFRVQLSDHVKRVLEMHSLLSKDEVIGLLGGRPASRDRAEADGGPPLVEVSRVFPCSAIEASGIECEMDPVSEMQACEYFEHQGVSLIGWYHSHPSFVANPSKRDIETQLMYQSVFTGGFVGLIVRPGEPQSDICCFHVVSDAPFQVDMDVGAGMDVGVNVGVGMHTNMNVDININMNVDEAEHLRVVQRLLGMYSGAQVEEQWQRRLSLLLPNDQCRRAAGLLRGDIDIET